MGEIIHIGFEINEIVAAGLDSRIYADIEDDQLNIKVSVRPNVIYQCIEWTVPGLLAAYLLKPYFEGFLKEAGKDHYDKLKICLTKLLKLGYRSDAGYMASDKSPEKLMENNSQSAFISIYVQLKNGKILKLLYDRNLSESYWYESTYRMLDLVRDHYKKFPNDVLSNKLNNLQYDINPEFYCVINPNTEDWDILDLQTIHEYSKNGTIDSKN